MSRQRYGIDSDLISVGLRETKLISQTDIQIEKNDDLQVWFQDASQYEGESGG